MPDLHELLAGDVRQWAEFDIDVRRTWWSGGSPRTPREALAVEACAPDGHLRQAAVSRLSVGLDPEALPLLLIRCVDWVPQVRAAARKAVLSKLDESALRAMLPLIGVLRRRQVDDWMTKLLRDTLPRLLDTALASGDRESRRWTHEEATRAGLLPPARLLEIALRDNDFRIRSRCGDALLDRGEAVEELLAAGTPKIRMRALTLLDLDTAVAHLADRASAVRSMAQALLLKAGDDPAAHYRALPATAGVVAGLGETGTAADAERLERHLTDERPRFRAPAVRGLRRVAPESTAVRPLLTDPSPAVTRQVVEFLRGKPALVDEPALQALLSPANPVHTRRAAAALLRDRDSWLRLHTDLSLLHDPALGEGARQDLFACRQHLTGVYTKPSARVRADLEAACADLDPALAREIRLVLGFST
jgi:HEAT repeat protein